jgi:hypothetical protein
VFNDLKRSLESDGHISS